MIVRIDHVVICMPDLQQAIAQYTKLGFNVFPGGSHPGLNKAADFGARQENPMRAEGHTVAARRERSKIAGVGRDPPEDRCRLAVTW